jgi:hypothetical protein
MLRYFRAIREKLIAESRFRRYAIYALGEIILISIGLLIALQLNMLNDKRKTRQFEHKMLSEIRSALAADIWYFGLLNDRLNRLDSTASILISLYGRDLEKMDTVNNLLRGLRTDIQFYSNRGAYEALKSSGLDKLSVDSLRRALVRHYDFWLPRNENLIREEKAESGKVVESVWYDVFRDYPRESDTGDWLWPGMLLRHDEMNSDERYLRILINRKSYAVIIKQRLENVGVSAESLISMLDAVLGTDQQTADR